MKRTQFVTLLFCLAFSFNAATKSSLFPNSSWPIIATHGPGTVTHKLTGMTFPLPGPRKIHSVLKTNEFVSTLSFSAAPVDMTLSRVCQHKVPMTEVPGQAMPNQSDAISAWSGTLTHSGGIFKTVLYELAGSGIFIGAHSSENHEAIIKTMFTVEPVGAIPTEAPEVEHEPNTSKADGLFAVADAIAGNSPLHVSELAPYMKASGTEQGALLIHLWLDKNNVILPAHREVRDPCDPRYGKVVAAHKLYQVKIIQLGDANGIHYFVQTNVADVSTGIIQQSYSPNMSDVDGDLGVQVKNALDGLNLKFNGISKF
jgi:hypothetical protein